MIHNFIRFIIAVFISIALLSCADTQSINQESALSYAKVVNQAKVKGAVDNNSPLAIKIKKVFNKMRPVAERENKTGIPFNWEITVVRSPELNAWAMPGGKMMFYTGLVQKLKLNDDEIATIMGHEMSHALQEHGKKRTNFGTATSILSQVANVALATQGIGNAGDMIGLVKSLGLDMPYSRSQESEADREGIFLMAKAGYNPQLAPIVWDKMSAATGQSTPAFLSTHPSDQARKQQLMALVPKAMEYYNQTKK